MSYYDTRDLETPNGVKEYTLRETSLEIVDYADPMPEYQIDAEDWSTDEDVILEFTEERTWREIKRRPWTGDEHSWYDV